MNTTALTALLTASFALLGLTLGKDSKVSEFRQQWIDGLRADVAEFLASVQQLFGFRVAAKYHGEKVKDEMRHTALLRTNKLISRIRLRLDPKKDESKDLIREMERLNFIAHDGELHQAELLNQARVVEDFTTVLLDKAWERVKSGEMKYQVCVWASIAFIVGSVIALIIEAIPRLHLC